MSRKTLKRQLDAAWSTRVRARGACERCGKDDGVLHAHHMVGRRRHITRWDLRNGVCVCYRCHRTFEEDPFEFASWAFEHRAEDVRYLLSVKDQPARFTDRDLVRLLAALVELPEAEAA